MRALVVLFTLLAPPLAAAATCDEIRPGPLLVDDIEDVVLVGHQLRSIRHQGSSVRLEYALRVASVDGAAYQDVTATVTGPWAVYAERDTVTFAEVLPTGEVVSDEVLVLQIPIRRWARVVRGLAQRPIELTLGGLELPVLAPGVHYLDEETDLAFVKLSGGIYWFSEQTALLSQLHLGTALVGPPPTDTWDADWFHPEYLPSDPDDCGRYFPFQVAEVLEGDGTNGGEPGWYGLRATEERPSPLDLYSSFRAGSGVGGGRPLVDGPLDGFQWYRGQALAIQTENEQDYRFCAPGVSGYDYNDDSVPDECHFAGAGSRMNFQPVPGLFLTGNVHWEAFATTVIAQWRYGQPHAASFTFTGTVNSAFGVRSEVSLDLEKTEREVLRIPIPLFGAQEAMPPGVDLDVTGMVTVGGEGHIEAGTSYGVVRSEAWEIGLEWTAEDGISSYRERTATTLPMTAPRIETDVSGAFEVYAGLGVEAALTETISHSSFRVAVQGLTGVRLGIDPAASPWWTIDTTNRGVISGHLNLVGGLYGTQLWEEELFGAEEALTADDGRGPVGSEGTASRWFRTLQVGGAATEGTDAAVLADGDLVVTGGDGLHGYVARLTGEGEVVWARRMPFTRRISSVAVLSDDAIVASLETCAGAIRFDADGNKIWQKLYAVDTHLGACNVVPFTDGDGVEGVILGSGLLDGRPSFGFVDTHGDVRWWRTLDSDGFIEGGEWLTDGRLLLVGRTDEPAHFKTQADGWWDSEGGGLLLAIDPYGELDWAVSANGGRFYDVVERADGSLLGIGHMIGYHYHPRHGTWLAAFDADGEVLWNTTMAEDVVYEGRVDSPIPTLPGDSAYDEGIAAAMFDGEAFVLGNTGLGVDAAARVTRLDDRGEPRWFRMWNGVAEDTFAELVEAGDSLLAVGTTLSFDGGKRAALVRVPADGVVGFASSYGGRSPALQPEFNDSHDPVHVFGFYDRARHFLPNLIDVPVTVTTQTTSSRFPTPIAAETIERTW